MKCRKCGTYLTATPLSNCPECGPPEVKGKWRALRYFFGLLHAVAKLLVVILLLFLLLLLAKQ